MKTSVLSAHQAGNGRFSVLETFGNSAEGKGLDAGQCFVAIPTVAQHAQ